MKNNTAACEVRGVTFRYFREAKRNILDNVDLAFAEGRVSVVLGTSGCGKSTLAALLCGLFPENGGWLGSGSVLVNGSEVLSMEHHLRCRQIAEMFQNPDLQFCMRDLREELLFCMENLRIPQDEMPSLLAEHARRYHAEALLDRPFHLLSGGEKQRAALCCLFLLKPKILVLDEPFANLDEAARLQYLDLLRDYLAEEDGATVIAIDHRAENWIGLADTFLVLGDGGRLRKEIPAGELEKEREFLVGEGLNDPFRPAPAIPAAAAADGSEKDPAPDDALLAVRGAAVFHKKAKSPVLSAPCLTAKKGEMIACLGPSGSGKTSLFMTLLGQKKYTGSIRLAGRELSGIRPRDLFRQVGIVFQNPASQFVTSSVQAEAAAGLSEERTLELLEEFGLRHYRRYSPFMLSQGQQRRLGVLTMLSRGQSLLLLDEPTYGQDGRSCAAIMEHLKKLAAGGITVIFSTHDRALAASYADRFWLVEGGTAHETY